MSVSRITTILKAAASRNLVTRERFKQQLNKTSTDRDDYLDWMIKAASSSVENYCNVTFALETLLDSFRFRGGMKLNWDRFQPERGLDSTRTPELVLSRFPVKNIYAVVDFSISTTILASPMTNVQTTLPCVAALAGTFPFTVLVDSGANAEVMTVTALISGTNYTVTRGVSNNAVAHSAAVPVNVALDPSLYEWNPDTAIIARLSLHGSPIDWNADLVSVAFQAGYLLPSDSSRDLPYDVEDATMRYLRYMWFTGDRDPTLRSEGEPGLGNKLYWIGPPGEGSNMPPDVQAILDNYRVPNI